ncbi:MAG: hypothetical protein M1814_004216 [Vezdaea aestivalis]|nr:MAG: hypothetical protein M1814_004216 [Vezdaea aestivalis]
MYDISIGSTEALVSVASSISITYVLIHITAILRSSQLQKSSNPASPSMLKIASTLESSCFVLLRLLVVIWFGAAAVGVSIAFNQANCRPASAAGSLWQKGTSCILHRTSVAVASIALLTVCALLLTIEISPNAFDTGTIRPKDEEAGRHHDVLSTENLLKHTTPAASPVNSIRSTSTIKVGKGKTNAIPNNLPYSSSRSSSWGSSWASLLPASSRAGSLRAEANPSPSISDCTIQSGVMAGSQVGSGVLQRGSSVRIPSPSVQSASSSMRSTYRRSLLSSMRRIENPDALVIPEVLRPARRRLPSGWMCPIKVGITEPVAAVTPTGGEAVTERVAKEEEMTLEIDSHSEAGRLESPRKTIALARSKAVSGVHRFNVQRAASKGSHDGGQSR